MRLLSCRKDKLKSMDKLKRLLEICKCGVYLTINQHRDYYESVEDFFIGPKQDEKLDMDDPEDLEAFDRMKSANNVVELHFYPNTPISFYDIFDSDIDKVLDRAFAVLVRDNVIDKNMNRVERR